MKNISIFHSIQHPCVGKYGNTYACENILFIYHATLSVGNPLVYPVVRDEAYKYFSQHPCFGKYGNIIHVKELPFLKSMRSFH